MWTSVFSCPASSWGRCSVKKRTRPAEDAVGLAGWTVYIDGNNNKRLDPGEVSTLTDAAGSYFFAGLAIGTYTVREVVNVGFTQTWPDAAADGANTISITTSNVFLTDKSFANVASGPEISALSPNSGPGTGGTRVTITGTNLDGATAVNFGAVIVSSFVSDTPTQLVVMSPAGAGIVHITVTTPDGTSDTSTADLFTYLGPLGTINTDMPTFTWTPVAGAGSYTLWVDDNTTGASPVLKITGATGSPLTLTAAQALTPGHRYTWYYGAVIGSKTTWSSGADFTIAPLAAPTPGGPTGDITIDKPLFGWTAVAGAASYSVWLADQATGAVTVIAKLTTNSYTPATALRHGDNYTWYAAAVSTNGNVTSWSGALSFRIAPVLGVLGATLATDQPTFTWTGLAGTGSYQVWLSDQTVPGVLQLPAGASSPFTLPASQALTPGHVYTWYVGAGTGATTIWSTGQTFTVAALAPRPPAVPRPTP